MTPALSLRTIEDASKRGDENKNRRNHLRVTAIENGCGSLSADEEKLPGQDSNLDKENQNLFAERCKHKSTKGLEENQRAPLAQTLARETENDPDLARLVELWEQLPQAGRKLLRQAAETICGELNRPR